MSYFEVFALLVGLIIVGMVTVLVIAVVRVTPADIPAVVKEAGNIMCHLLEVLYRSPAQARPQDASLPHQRTTHPGLPEDASVMQDADGSGSRSEEQS